MSQQESYCRASLRIAGDGLDPDEITQRLHIVPELAHKKGDVNSTISKNGKLIRYADFRTGLWVVRSEIDEHRGIEEHIANIFDRLEPRRQEFLEICEQGCKADIFCGFFFPTSKLWGILLSNDIVRRSASFGVEIGIELYPMPSNVDCGSADHLQPGLM